ncbi:hypothetical protein E2C01_052216 [Portunus trituberculatus]|uniref:Uncharacterized protein n=1 Tax=Portunus trituberculatus TaxID=210409 RepID=A0A5B7GD27_PORTR|nr:hypothetical protein [Portunus trituberculatus]
MVCEIDKKKNTSYFTPDPNQHGANQSTSQLAIEPASSSDSEGIQHVVILESIRHVVIVEDIQHVVLVEGIQHVVILK